MMEEMEKSLRRQANIQGGALLIYWVAMNICVFFVMVTVALAHALTASLSGFGGENAIPMIMEKMTTAMMETSGWGYLLAVAIGLLILLLWKKPTYIRHTLLQKGRPMGFGSFLALLSLVMGCQLLAQLNSFLLEWLARLLGFSMTSLLESVSVDTGSLPMLLYVGIAAPISEELLFRGLLLRSIEPYNKKLAIFASALLFGLYHGNPVQTPYAFCVGLILAYAALEYNVIWAMVLHLFNNLLFADSLPRLLSGLPDIVSDWIQWAIITGFFLAGLFVVLAKHREIATYWRRETVEPWQRKAFFRSPTVIILIVICMGSMVSFVLMGLFLA